MAVCFQSIITPAQSVNNLSVLSNEVVELANDKVFDYGYFSFSIKNCSTGATLLEAGSQKVLVPASNQKLVTTAAVLGILGPEYKYETKLFRDGTVGEDGVLRGDLIIKGSGDPFLGSDRLEGYFDLPALLNTWADAVKAAGIKKVDGAVVADASVFNTHSVPDNWAWGDIGNYYGAGAFGININENQYKIYFQTGTKEGEPTVVKKTEPVIPGLKIVNEVKTGAAGSGDNAYIYAAPYSDVIYIRGTIPVSKGLFSIKGSIPDPPLVAAQLLKAKLEQIGISISASAKTISESFSPGSNSKLLSTVTSPPLSEIARLTNTYSINLYAEVLLKTVGAVKTGIGSTEAGLQVLKDFWASKGVDMKGTFLFDGSGLSLNNGISANTLTQMMVAVSKDTTFNSFYNSLPVAGVSGTVSRLCKGGAGEKKVRLKSGTLNKVICYTGYVEGEKGTLYAFSIMANKYTCYNSQLISKIEKVLNAMAVLD
ncbi:MAG TPA: D-alanyl-D-alanine carboxypeptidase/D-alanyl-D-alanine-endopeptidase [Cytophagaceae bacterium]